MCLEKRIRFASGYSIFRRRICGIPHWNSKFKTSYYRTQTTTIADMKMK